MRVLMLYRQNFVEHSIISSRSIGNTSSNNEAKDRAQLHWHQTSGVHICLKTTSANKMKIAMAMTESLVHNHKGTTGHINTNMTL